MARIAMDEFGDGTEVVRVYLAGRLAEAQAVEAALDAAGIVFAVEVEPLPSRGLFSASRTGAGVWVREPDLDAAAGVLERAGLVAGLVER